MNSWCIYKKSVKNIEKPNFYSHFRFFVGIGKNAEKNTRFFHIFKKLSKLTLKLVKSSWICVLGSILAGFGGVHFMKKIDSMTFRGSKRFFFVFQIFPNLYGYIFQGWSGESLNLFFCQKLFLSINLRKSQE